MIRDAAAAYRKTCPAANFTFAFDDSERGLTTVDEQGHGNPGLLAITDGPKGVGYPDLLARPLAMAVFAVIVHGDSGVHDLTGDQIKNLFEGRITNWAQLGGPDQPVRLVNRSSGSGTRETFQQQLLGGDSVTLPEAGYRTIQATDPPGAAACEVPLPRRHTLRRTHRPRPVQSGHVKVRRSCRSAGREIIVGSQRARDNLLHDFACATVDSVHS